MHPIFRLLLTTAALAGQVVAAEPVAPVEGAPKTDIATLLRVQSGVQKLLPQVRQAVVAIQTGGGTASGVIISPSGLILTAAHVVGKPGRDIRVVLEDGTVTKATSLGLDQKTDAALAQLKDRGKPCPSVNLSRAVAKAQQLREHLQLQPVITLSADGQSASARWRLLGVLGQYEEYARWQTGPYETA